jgi:hypothetical protein
MALDTTLDPFHATQFFRATLHLTDIACTSDFTRNSPGREVAA